MIYLFRVFTHKRIQGIRTTSFAEYRETIKSVRRIEVHHSGAYTLWEHGTGWTAKWKWLV